MTTQRNSDYGKEMMKAYQNKFGKVQSVPNKSSQVNKSIPAVSKPLGPKASQLSALTRMKKL